MSLKVEENTYYEHTNVFGLNYIEYRCVIIAIESIFLIFKIIVKGNYFM